MPTRGRRGARFVSPGAAVGAREPEDLEVPSEGRLQAGVPPREVVDAGPNQDF